MRRGQVGCRLDLLWSKRCRGSARGFPCCRRKLECVGFSRGGYACTREAGGSALREEAGIPAGRVKWRFWT